MNKQQFLTDMTALVTALIATIGDQDRASEDDSESSMQLTVGANRAGWSYQTGDNSYTGGAYGYSNGWAIVSLYRDSSPSEVAQSIVSQCEEYSAGPEDPKNDTFSESNED